jgi:hypothetical protein
MPTYTVTIRETCIYEIEVECDSADEAGDTAEDTLVHCPNMNNYFVACEERDVADVQEVPTEITQNT